MKAGRGDVKENTDGTNHKHSLSYLDFFDTIKSLQ